MARSLLPREHGAYGQLGVPLAVALAAGRPGFAAVALAAAVIAAFLAHEPALVLAGHRGARARRDDGGRARRRLTMYALAAAILGGGAIVVAGVAVLAAAALVAVLAAVTAALVALGRERTLAGETWAASTLAAAALPVALAAGAEPAAALRAWLCWTLGFTAATGAVRATIAAAKHRPRVAPLAGVAVSGAATAGLAVAVDGAVLASAPLVLAALALALWPPPPRQLRRVGWVLVAASLATGAALVALAG